MSSSQGTIFLETSKFFPEACLYDACEGKEERHKEKKGKEKKETSRHWQVQANRAAKQAGSSSSSYQQSWAIPKKQAGHGARHELEASALKHATNDDVNESKTGME